MKSTEKEESKDSKKEKWKQPLSQGLRRVEVTVTARNTSIDLRNSGLEKKLGKKVLSSQDGTITIEVTPDDMLFLKRYSGKGLLKYKILGRGGK